MSRKTTAEMALAFALADIADEMLGEAYNRPMPEITQKSDSTIVTELDRQVEGKLIERLRREYPADAILAEESGLQGGSSAERIWTIDPLDGTENFVRGIPAFGTILGMQIEQRVQLAVVSAPLLRQRWWAAAGAGSFMSSCDASGSIVHRRITVSTAERLCDASVSHGGIRRLGRYTEPFWQLCKRLARVRGFGNFWSHVLVAEGAFDLALTGRGSGPWDILPLSLIVSEAGGRLTAASGEPWTGGEPVLTSNGRLHDQTVRLLAAEAYASG